MTPRFSREQLILLLLLAAVILGITLWRFYTVHS